MLSVTVFRSIVYLLRSQKQALLILSKRETQPKQTGDTITYDLHQFRNFRKHSSYCKNMLLWCCRTFYLALLTVDIFFLSWQGIFPVYHIFFFLIFFYLLVLLRESNSSKLSIIWLFKKSLLPFFLSTFFPFSLPFHLLSLMLPFTMCHISESFSSYTTL